MSDALPIPAEAIEAASLAFDRADSLARSGDECIEAAIRAAFKEMGLRVERDIWRAAHVDVLLGRERLVSAWGPTEELIDES